MEMVVCTQFEHHAAAATVACRRRRKGLMPVGVSVLPPPP